ncbi:MAG: hypothetical protein ACRBB0_14840 [Pelagimonas sp.]|uniref:hypothetical protein n=1 Tax=Pelagimonas sp. TaxID=2073170 RepID=UPI003D6B1D85
MTLFRTALMGGAFFACGVCAETEIENTVSIELNATQPSDSGCTLSFLATNGHQNDVRKAVYEAVLFDENHQVDRLMLFDFGELPTKRPRVRQFMVPDLACANLSLILINGANQCDGQGLPDRACIDGLHVGSRVNTEVQG